MISNFKRNVYKGITDGNELEEPESPSFPTEQHLLNTVDKFEKKNVQLEEKSLLFTPVKGIDTNYKKKSPKKCFIRMDEHPTCLICL